MRIDNNMLEIDNILFYAENQPRDTGGRFTHGGAGVQFHPEFHPEKTGYVPKGKNTAFGRTDLGKSAIAKAKDLAEKATAHLAKMTPQKGSTTKAKEHKTVHMYEPSNRQSKSGNAYVSAPVLVHEKDGGGHYSGHYNPILAGQLKSMGAKYHGATQSWTHNDFKSMKAAVDAHHKPLATMKTHESNGIVKIRNAAQEKGTPHMSPKNGFDRQGFEKANKKKKSK